jgi:hypothetical protein
VNKATRQVFVVLLVALPLALVLLASSLLGRAAPAPEGARVQTDTTIQLSTGPTDQVSSISGRPRLAASEPRYPVTLPDRPPDASRITVGYPDVQGFTTITGTAGAVVTDAVVAITCLDTSIVEFFQAQANGSFTATVFAPAGTAVQIKHIQFYEAIVDLDVTFRGTVPGDIIVEWMNATPGTIVFVPFDHTATGGGTPFAWRVSSVPRARREEDFSSP